MDDSFTCSGITKAGDRCKRKINEENGRCFQHPSPLQDTPSTIQSGTSLKGVVLREEAFLKETPPPSPNLLKETLLESDDQVPINTLPSLIEEGTGIPCYKDPKCGVLIGDQVQSSISVLAENQTQFSIGATGGEQASKELIEPKLETPLIPPPTITTEIPDPLDEEEKMLRTTFWEQAKLITFKRG